jgi:hypothetical protein
MAQVASEVNDFMARPLLRHIAPLHQLCMEAKSFAELDVASAVDAHLNTANEQGH